MDVDLRGFDCRRAADARISANQSKPRSVCQSAAFAAPAKLIVCDNLLQEQEGRMFVNKMEKEAVASLRPVGGWSKTTQAGLRGAHETSECKKLAESGSIFETILEPDLEFDRNY